LLAMELLFDLEPQQRRSWPTPVPRCRSCVSLDGPRVVRPRHAAGAAPLPRRQAHGHRRQPENAPQAPLTVPAPSGMTHTAQRGGARVASTSTTATRSRASCVLWAYFPVEATNEEGLSRGPLRHGSHSCNDAHRAHGQTHHQACGHWAIGWLLSCTAAGTRKTRNGTTL
jgi:hypothetical protein